MAKKTQSTEPRFYEIVVETKPKQIRAFIAGLQIGRCENFPIWLNHETGIFHEGVAEKLAESAHLRPRDCHFVTSEILRNVLRTNEKQILTDGGIRLVSARRIRSARFSFQFQAYGKRYGDEIMDLMQKLPDGLKLKGFKPKEIVDPNAAGIEGYASAHDYELSGQGEITGRIDLAIEFRNKMHQLPLIKLKKITLTLA